MGQNQSDRQASIRAVTGTAWTYEGDWHALFDQAGIASGDYNGRLLAWINQSMGASYAELNGAMSAFAASQSAPSWNEMGTFTPGSAPVAAWDASTSTLAQLAVLATHTRTSLATMFDSTGKLTYGPNNLLTYSNTFSNAAWSTVTATITGGVSDPVGGTAAFTMTAAGASSQLYQTFSGVGVGASAIVSVWIRRRTGTGAVFLYDMTGSATAVTGSVTGSWSQVFVKKTVASGSVYAGLLLSVSGDAIDIYFATTSIVTYETSPRTADQVITTSSAYYGPRIDYDPNTLAVKGLLIEEARTNLAFQSRSLANATWSKVSITVGSDSTLGVDGITADLLTTTNFIVEHLIYNVAHYTVVSGSTYTFTTFRKAGTGRYWQLGMQGTTGYVSGVFDLSLTADASAVQTSSAIQTLVSATSKYLGSGWHRLQVTFTVASGTAAYIIESAANANGSNTFSGYGSVTNGPANVTYYGSGSQAELGSFATSYIPTSSASVARASDALTAASLTTNPAIIQLRDIATGTRSRKVINPWSGISSETNEWIEAIRIYPSGTSGTYLNTKLTVDGPW